jgi:hypothetical protein
VARLTGAAPPAAPGDDGGDAVMGEAGAGAGAGGSGAGGGQRDEEEDGAGPLPADEGALQQLMADLENQIERWDLGFGG